MKINKETGVWAIYGGMLLGGGGGGDLQEGLRILDLALSHTPDIPLRTLNEIDGRAFILTASLVGSPASDNRYVAPEHYERVYRLFRQCYPYEIGGIITNELGAQSSTNGWVLAAVTGLPLIDAPCNGRAHPTGVMGSLGLSQEKGYRSVQAAVGGKDERETELCVQAELGRASALVRSAASAAGGFVTVLRNPVRAGYVAQHAAASALSRSIGLGRALIQAVGNVNGVILALEKELGIETLCRGVISKHILNTEGGFDNGTLIIETNGAPVEVTFWNEFMTVERAGKRIATFPDLIAVLDEENGLPQTSAAAHAGQKVVLIRAGKDRLTLGSSMKNQALFEEAEKHLNKELIKYVF